MALYKIYESNFISRKDSVWRFEIWREQDAAPDSVVTSRNPGESPLRIEWLETAKEDVVCGSAATLKLVSPGDRTFLDYYTDKPDGMRLKVYRDGALFWEGFLDPETYEEPYSEDDDYEVTLTFSDFGILDRLKYNLSGMQTISAMLRNALQRAGFSGAYNTQNISTMMEDSILPLARIGVRSDNFYDEDGEAMTLREVVEGVLRPFGLRMVQRCGVIWLYDLNGLYNNAGTEMLVWCSSDQRLGAERIYNHVKISLSIYDDEKFSEEFEYKGETDPSSVNWDQFPNGSGYLDPGYHSFAADYDQLNFSQIDSLSFTLFNNSEADGVELLQDGLNFFKILPVQSGQEARGVAVMFYVGQYDRHYLSSNWETDSTLVRRFGYLPGGQAADGLTAGTELFRTEGSYIGRSGSQYSLRLQMQALFDVRYNPFTELTEYNEKAASKKLFQTRRVYVPVKLELVSATGTILYHYSNRTARSLDDAFIGIDKSRNRGEWLSGAAAYDDCELAFDQDKEKWNDSNVFQGGWIGNRQNITMNRQRGALLKAAEYGQYIPMPPVAGYLRVTVCAGMRRSEKDSTPSGDSYEWKNAHDLLRWILFTVPQLAVVNNDATYSAAKGEDVEYIGLLNANAREDLELDEICGSAESAPPTARCQLYIASTGALVDELTRGGRTARPEQLLIGTLFSQYAERKQSLEGTAEIGTAGLVKYTDTATPGKCFMMIGEEIDAREEETRIRVAEFDKDRFEEG